MACLLITTIKLFLLAYNSHVAKCGGITLPATQRLSDSLGSARILHCYFITENNSQTGGRENGEEKRKWTRHKDNGKDSREKTRRNNQEQAVILRRQIGTTNQGLIRTEHMTKTKTTRPRTNHTRLSFPDQTSTAHVQYSLDSHSHTDGSRSSHSDNAYSCMHHIP